MMYLLGTFKNIQGQHFFFVRRLYTRLLTSISTDRYYTKNDNAEVTNRHQDSFYDNMPHPFA